MRSAFELLAIVVTVWTATCAEAAIGEKWTVRYNGTAGTEDDGVAVATDSVGNVLMTGISPGFGTNNDFYTAKYSPHDGTPIWEKRYNLANGSDAPRAIAVDGSDNVIVAGSGYVSGTALYNYLVIKLAGTDGTILWTNGFSGFSSDNLRAMTLDAAGNVIVTGDISKGTQSNPESRDIYTMKFAASNGAVLWEKRYNGPAGIRDDYGWAVTTDSVGNVIVTGTSVNGSGSGQIFTIKYSAANGTPLWEQRYAGISALASGVIVDAADNPVIVGQFYNTAISNYDLYTAKYAAATGAVIWERTYNSPMNDSEYSAAITRDAAGDIAVTAQSANFSGNFDYLIVKYAGANGNFLWDARYSGAGNGEDAPFSIAADRAGNFVLTGHVTTGPDKDIYTVKYAGANGAVLWQRLYQGIFYQGDEDMTYASHSNLALTPDGGAIITGRAISLGPQWDIVTMRIYDPTDADGDGLIDSWETANYGSIAAHSANDDADGDGLRELVELGFGTNPRVPDAAKAPLVINEGGYLTITIPKRLGVSYSVQTAGDLNSGSFSAATTTVLINNDTTLKVRDNTLIGTPPRRFLRTKITSSP